MSGVALKRVCSLVTDPGPEEERVSVALEHIIGGTGKIVSDVELPRRRPAAGLAAVKPGDVLFGKLRPYLAKTFRISEPMFASTELLALRPKADIDSRWLHYLVMSDRVVRWAVATSDGSKMPRTSWSAFGEFRTVVPKLREQRAIADFLDAETARIDALIEKKRKLMHLLGVRYREERRLRVLRDLDPITGSGLDVLGWRVAQLGVLIGLQRGHDLPVDLRVNGTVPVISSGGPSGWHDEVAVLGPGVVTGRYGTVGEVYYVDGPYWPLNTTLYVSDFRGHDPRWIYHLLSVLPLDSDSAKSAVTGINRNVIGVLRVPVPSLDEQRRLAEELDAESVRVNRIILKLRRQLALLTEHRQALITAAVTGQLEVPGSAAPS